MKKKLVVMMVTLALTASSVACGAPKIEPAKNNDAVEADSSEAAPADETTEEASEEASEAATADASAEEDSNESISGSISGNTYENKYFNVKYTLGDNYRFATEDEIKTLNSALGDLDAIKDNKAAKKALDEGAVMTVAYAMDSTKGKTLTVVIQSVNSIVGSLINEEAILTAGKADVEKGLEAQGLSNVTSEVENVTFLGEEHPSLKITGTINGAVLNERMVCLVKGNYIILFAASGLDNDFDSELLSATTVE